MPEFLKLTSLADARDLIHRNLAITGFEEELIDTLHSLGRVISRPVKKLGGRNGVWRLENASMPKFCRKNDTAMAVISMELRGAPRNGL